jgi:tellurite resistance protein TehA-like permease
MFILFTCWHCWMIIIIFFEYINLQDFLIVYENPR